MFATLASPTRVFELDTLDAHSLDTVFKYLGGTRVALIRDARTELASLDATLAHLRPAAVFQGITPDPRSADVMAMLASVSAFGPDLIMAVGGGSVMDAAKAIAMLLANGGDLDDYLGPNATRKAEVRGPRLVLVPTTTGTGAEVTRFGVFTARSGRKYSLNTPLLQADCALLVSELVASLPPPLVAATGFDALTHALETLWNRNATLVSDALATDAAVEVLRALEPAWDQVSGAKARLLRAACQAGIAFNQTGTAAIHALSFIPSEEWHVPHGVACAFFLEEILEFNLRSPQVRGRLAKVARSLTGEALDDDAAVAFLQNEISRLRQKMQLPNRFAQLGVTLAPQHLTALFEKSLEDFKMKNNLIPFGIADLHALILGKC